MNIALQSDMALLPVANLILLSMVDILEDPVQVHCPEGMSQIHDRFDGGVVN